MNIENLKEIIHFTNTEKELVSRFKILGDAFLPLLLSLRDGGDWSYSAENIKTIAVMDKTTVYDEERKVRLLVRRPYRVKIGSDRIIKVTVNPLEKEIKGGSLWEFKFADI